VVLYVVLVVVVVLLCAAHVLRHHFPSFSPPVVMLMTVHSPPLLAQYRAQYETHSIHTIHLVSHFIADDKVMSKMQL